MSNIDTNEKVPAKIDFEKMSRQVLEIVQGGYSDDLRAFAIEVALRGVLLAAAKVVEQDNLPPDVTWGSDARSTMQTTKQYDVRAIRALGLL